MSSPVYIPDDVFKRLAEKIAKLLDPHRTTRVDSVNDVKIALCEIGNIWPLSIALDAALNQNR